MKTIKAMHLDCENAQTDLNFFNQIYFRPKYANKIPVKFSSKHH